MMRQYTTLGFILYCPKESNHDRVSDNVDCVMKDFSLENAQITFRIYLLMPGLPDLAARAAVFGGSGSGS